MSLKQNPVDLSNLIIGGAQLIINAIAEAIDKRATLRKRVEMLENTVKTLADYNKIQDNIINKVEPYSPESPNS